VAGEILTAPQRRKLLAGKRLGINFCMSQSMQCSTRSMQRRFARPLSDSVGTSFDSRQKLWRKLRTQLRSATEQDATRIVITSTELSRSVRLDGSPMDACCQAMLDELKDGDVVLRDKGSGARMIVRYLLSRSG
jgi:hypothetical protein